MAEAPADWAKKAGIVMPHALSNLTTTNEFLEKNEFSVVPQEKGVAFVVDYYGKSGRD
jgi:hypothetical protein